MIAVVGRRAATAVLVLVLTSVLVHGLVSAQGDPLASLRQRDPPVAAEVIEQRRRELGLDRPAPERYLAWLGSALQGDLGEDLQGRPVAPRVGRHLLVTLRLVVAAVTLALVAAVVAGTYSAARQHSVADHLITVASFVLLSTPAFWLATLLKEHVALPVNRALGFPAISTVGSQTPNLAGGWWTGLADQLGHLVLPALALALVLFASWSRFQRSAVLDVLAADHVRLARATGTGGRRVLVHHVVRNSLAPLTSVVAVDLSVVVGGAVLVEKVFAWRGMGTLLVEGVSGRDPNLVLGWLMVSGVVVVAASLVADVLYAVIDPRVRRG